MIATHRSDRFYRQLDRIMSIDISIESSRLTAERFGFVDNGCRCECMRTSVIERSQVASEYKDSCLQNIVRSCPTTSAIYVIIIIIMSHRLSARWCQPFTRSDSSMPVGLVQGGTGLVRCADTIRLCHPVTLSLSAWTSYLCYTRYIYAAYNMLLIYLRISGTLPVPFMSCIPVIMSFTSGNIDLAHTASLGLFGLTQGLLSWCTFATYMLHKYKKSEHSTPTGPNKYVRSPTTHRWSHSTSGPIPDLFFTTTSVSHWPPVSTQFRPNPNRTRTSPRETKHETNSCI